jgi:hypothetical protein
MFIVESFTKGIHSLSFLSKFQSSTLVLYVSVCGGYSRHRALEEELTKMVFHQLWWTQTTTGSSSGQRHRHRTVLDSLLSLTSEVNNKIGLFKHLKESNPLHHVHQCSFTTR